MNPKTVTLFYLDEDTTPMNVSIVNFKRSFALKKTREIESDPEKFALLSGHIR